MDATEVGAGARQVAAGELLLGLMVDQDADDLAGRNLAHDFAIDPADGVELVGPVGGMVRPAEPSGFVRFPFGGYGEAQRGGGGGGVDRVFGHNGSGILAPSRSLGKPNGQNPGVGHSDCCSNR